jgi:hypothetical protein
MSIEYGTIIQIRFQSKEDETFFVERVSEEGMNLRTQEGDKLFLRLEDSDILEVFIVYIPPKPDYASIHNLYVGNWIKVYFKDEVLYGKLVHTGNTLEIESEESTYYIPVKYGLPKEVLSIEASVPPQVKREKEKEKEKETEADTEDEKIELDMEMEDVEDTDEIEEYGQLFYTMEQKKNELTESLMGQLTKQSQSSLKKVYHQVQRFQELFEKYTQFERNILLKKLPENLYLDSFLKNTNPFFTPVSNHVKVKHRDYENQGFFPNYYTLYRDPSELYEPYVTERTQQLPYQDFIHMEAKLVQAYILQQNHTEREFYPTQNREVYLMDALVKYRVPESFVTESFVLQPYRIRGTTILDKIRPVAYFDMFFRKKDDDLSILHVNETYKAGCIVPHKVTWFKNECTTFESYVEHVVPSFREFMDCYLNPDFINIHQSLKELDTLHIYELNEPIFKEVTTRMKTNITKFTTEREKEKKQYLRRKPETTNPETNEFHKILQKEYSMGQRFMNMEPSPVVYTTSELWKEGMFDYFHFYIIQYLKKHVLLQQLVSDQEMGQLVQEIKAVFGKETEERVHKIYETEQQRENDQYKWVLQDIPQGSSFITADEELYRKLLKEKQSSLILDEVKTKLNAIKELGESEIPNQFEKGIEPYIHEFLIQYKIMKGQVAFVKETKKKYRWAGDKWADLSQDFQAKKLFKIKDFKYNEDSFKKKVHEMIHEFESEKLRTQALQKLKLEDEFHKTRLERAKRAWLKDTMKYHTEKYHYYELELQKELFEIAPSPYLPLRNRILQEITLENKYKAIQLFVDNYTKSGEDIHWYYCLETNTKLLPKFFLELADAFLKTDQYPEMLQKICDRQGELSDNNDFYVDKYSGFPIKQIQFDDEEGYNDQGFKDLFHSVVEQEKQKVEVDTQNPIRNALKAFLTLMGFLPEEDVLESLFINVEKSFLLADGDKKKSREQNQIYLYSILCHCLIYGQTLEGKVRLTKPFSDCPKSLKGYPLNNTSKKGLEFVCCVLMKIPKNHEPWNSMAQTKLDALLLTTEQFMEKYVLSIQDIREQLMKKREVHETKEEFPTWDHFYPRLKPLQVVPELSSIPSDRIMGLSFALQQKINDHTSTQLGVLVNQAQEPYLINTCCQENNDVYDYMIKNAKIQSTLTDLYEAVRKYRKHQSSTFANHMYSPMNTKTPIAKISNAYDERTIYRAIIKIFLFDSSTVPEKLKKYKILKPADYKKNDPFEKKMDLLREAPVTESTFVSILRDNATMFERRKGRVLVEVTPGTTPIDGMLGKERDLYDYCTVEIEEKMKFILSKVRDKYEKKKFQQCIQFYTLFRDQKQNDFLPKDLEHKQTMSQILQNKIMNLLEVFPSKIMNKKYLSTTLPKHWNLDEHHVENILEFTHQYYHNLATFYEDTTWEKKHEQLQLRDYKRWMTLTLPVSIRYTLYSYIYVSLFYDYLQQGMMDYVKIIVGIFLEEDKQALNFDKKQIDFLSDVAKKSETELKTERLKKLTKDARKAQTAMKDLKLGEWGVGLEKSLFKYDKTRYGEVLKEATNIIEGMDVPDEIYGMYGVDDGENLEGFDGDEYY